MKSKCEGGAGCRGIGENSRMNGQRLSFIKSICVYFFIHTERAHTHTDAAPVPPRPPGARLLAAGRTIPKNQADNQAANRVQRFNRSGRPIDYRRSDGRANPGVTLWGRARSPPLVLCVRRCVCARLCVQRGIGARQQQRSSARIRVSVCWCE